jgi:heme O synthase-like polyprenyltransferase
MNKFVVCLALPFVIWGASKIDSDLAFASFCSSLLYMGYCGICAAHAINQNIDRDIEERSNRMYSRGRPVAPPKEWHESSNGGDYKKF